MDRPRAIPTLFLRLQEAPRAVQEAFRGLPRRRCDSDPILDPLSAPKKEVGTSKIKDMLCTDVKKTRFRHFQLGSFSDLDLGLSWTLFGRSFGPQAMRNQSAWCPWAGQELIPTLFFKPRRPPRGVQEASQSVPRGLQEAKALQEASREPFRSRLDSILHPSGFPLGPFVHSFWTPGGSAK